MHAHFKGQLKDTIEMVCQGMSLFESVKNWMLFTCQKWHLFFFLLFFFAVCYDMCRGVKTFLTALDSAWSTVRCEIGLKCFNWK